MVEVDYSQQAAEQLEDLETETAERIVSKLDDVVWKPEHYLKRLILTAESFSGSSTSIRYGCS